MENATQKIVDIVTDKKEKLQGFKILGVFPFYLKYIRTGTHVKLCGIKAKLAKIKGDKEADLNDFHNYELQKQAKPIIDEFCIVALINQRPLGFLLKLFIKNKIKQCSPSQIHGLYSKILELGEPAFFLGYWTHLTKVDHTILKEEKPS